MLHCTSETYISDTIAAKAACESAARPVKENWHNPRSVALICVCVPRCASLLGVILRTSYSRFLLCLSKSRSDSLGPRSLVRIFFSSHNLLPVVKMQRYVTSRYSSFTGSAKNGLGSGPRLKGGLLIPHGSCLYT